MSIKLWIKNHTTQRQRISNPSEQVVTFVESDEHIRRSMVLDYEEFDYLPTSMDWIDSKTARPLTKYLHEPKIKFLLENRIDRVLC